jgi:undecaprenyl-phosphate galactose phosphotransferase
LEAKPGITGLWQVSGRNELQFDDRVRLDIAYCRNRSIWLDMQILLRTVSAVITARGAN